MNTRITQFCGQFAQENRCLLPAGFTRLACVAPVIVAPASTTPPTESRATLRPFGLGLCLVHLHGASTQIATVQRDDGFVGFAGVRHLDEREAACAAGLAVGYDAYFLDIAMFLKHGAQFRLRRGVGQVAYIKILHCSSSLGSSASLSAAGSLASATMRVFSLAAASRGGNGRSRKARVRASATERTAEIRRQASRIPQL